MNMKPQAMYKMLKVIEDIPGWYWISKRNFGEEFADKMCYLQEYMWKFFDKEEECWRESFIKTKKDIKQFVEENQDFADQVRERYLIGKMNEAIEMKNKLKESVGKDIQLNKLSKHKIQQGRKLNKRISGYQKALSGDGISDVMIETARNYPIESLIETQNHWALCPFHSEKTASFYTKNNYYYCFGCGEYGSTIDLYMHLNNCNFIQAVKSLQ